MTAQAIAPGEATMRVLVTKANGEVIEMQGDAIVELTPELDAALAEYRQVVSRALELEAIIKSHLKGA